MIGDGPSFHLCMYSMYVWLTLDLMVIQSSTRWSSGASACIDIYLYNSVFEDVVVVSAYV